MAAPAYASVGTYQEGTTSTVSCTVPSGVAANDIVVVFMYADADVTAMAPGFAYAGSAPVKVNNGGAGSHQLHVMWKRATGSDSGTYDFTLASSVFTSAQSVRYTGAILTGDPWDFTNGAQSGNTGVSTTPAVSGTTTGVDRLLVWAATNWAGGAWTPPSGFTERFDTGFELITAADKAQAVAGATGSITGSNASTDKEGAWIGALKPLGGGPIATYAVYSATGGDTSTLTTPSFTPSNGEFIVVKLATWDTASGMNAPTGGGQTYSPTIIRAPGNFNGWVGIYTATVSGSPGSMTISASPVGNTSHMMVVERWPVGSTLGATAGGDYGGSSTSTWSINITCTGTNSNVSWVMVDEVSADPATRAYTPAGTTEDGLQDGHAFSDSVLYAAYFPTTAPGTYSYGMTAPGFLDWNTAAVEIIPAAAAATDPPGGPPSSIPVPILLQFMMANARQWESSGVSAAAPASNPETGNGALGLAGFATAAKKVSQTGNSAFGLSAQATAQHVAVSSASSAAALAGIAAARKVAPASSVDAVGLSGQGTTKKIAKGVANSAFGLAGAGTEVKKTAETGLGAIGFAPYGPTQGQRAQSGRAAIGLSGAATAKHIGSSTAAANVGLTGTGTTKKTVGEVGSSSVGLSGRGAEGKKAPANSVGSLGLAGFASPKHVSKSAGASILALTAHATPGKRLTVAGSRALLGLSGNGLVYKPSSVAHDGGPTTLIVLTEPIRLKPVTYATTLEIQTSPTKLALQ